MISINIFYEYILDYLFMFNYDNYNDIEHQYIVYF